jgi:hypothetical protein
VQPGKVTLQESFSLGSGNGTPGEIAAFGHVIYVAGSARNIVAFNVNADG